MKKIIIFLFIVLTFNNTASGGFFGDVLELFFGNSFKEPSDSFLGVGSNVKDVRCKVEYTQLNLATGLEKTVKHTAQYEVLYIANGDNLMYLSAQDLTKNINIWLNENKNNVVADMTGINCKGGVQNFNIKYMLHPKVIWKEYKSCEDKYNVDLMNLLDLPEQWGYNVHIDRLIKDYDEGCKNYAGEGY
jgi:hypothetical protein